MTQELCQTRKFARERKWQRVNIIRFIQTKTESTYLYDYKTVDQALRFMRSHGHTEVPVVNQSCEYLGVLNEGDFLWHILDYGGYASVKNDRLSKLIHKGAVPALKITADDEELRAAALRCSIVPIVDDRNVFIGVIPRESILQYFAEKQQEEVVGGIA